MDFDLSGEGYTLILPTNTARDFNATGPQATGDVFEVYGFDANTSTSAEVTEVCFEFPHREAASTTRTTPLF